ncbi:MAG TPA: hypothetical protein VL854_13780 [Nitrososphaeraceae archaeon]|nr:hypothetical protein [Nitrososphaeraceae archaeon]
MVNTYDSSYFRAIKPRIIFKSIDWEDPDTYFTFNAHSTPKDINVIYADVENSGLETGTFNIIVEDSSNIINKDHLRNTKVFIELGKSEAELEHVMIGFGDIFNTGRPRTNYQEYRITGFGSQIQASELLLNTRQSANVTDLDDPTAKLSPRYNQNQLIERSFTSDNWRPLNKESVEELTGWKLDIDPRINTNYPIVNLHMQTFWEWLDEICSLNKALWWIDYNTGEEVLKVRFRSSVHSGITIKSGDLRTISDNADKVAYIKDVFSVEDNSSKEADVATRLYTITIADREEIAKQTGKTGHSSTTNKALAQQVIIQNDQRRITSLGLVLEKKGEPSSPKDRVNGQLVLDSGDNKPTGKSLATFKIPLGDIKEEKETIFIDDLDVKVRFLEGENKIWIVLYQRSGIDDGDPNDDHDNTIRWYHNNTFNATQPLYSGHADGGDYKERDNLTWSTTNQGPMYSFVILSNIKRIQARTNTTAVKSLRMKENVIDSSFLGTDAKNIAQYLSVNLADKSKAKRTVSDYRVTVPNNFLFRPNQLVSFNDGLSGITQDLLVDRVRYVISGLPGDPQIGALGAEISLSGLYNSLIGNCSCDV